MLAKIWKFLHLPKNIQLFIMRILQDQFLIGVTGVVLNTNKEILLLKHTYRGKGWSLPGGYLKGKEHPKEGLEREIKEETGLIVSIDQEMGIRTDRENARLDISCYGYFMGGTFTPSKEVSEAQFFSFTNLPLIPKSQLLLINNVLKEIQTPQVKTQPIETSKPSFFTQLFKK
jgi:ADP-ribose pyrophosphatase YjhB (NUDIX family)